MAVKNIEELLQKMDWELLWKQKQWLIKQQTDESAGLIHLLDDLQDIAVENHAIPENLVFPWKGEEVEDGG